MSKKGNTGERCAYCECLEGTIPGSPCLRFCEGCHQVMYCDPKCQRRHWKSHKTFCQKYSKKQASRFEPPLKVCDFCGISETQPDTLKACSGCLKMYYCTRECQTKHWKKEHKQECQKIAQTDEDDVCPVCLEKIDSNMCQLPCSHKLHKFCLEQLKKASIKQLCPLCRLDLPENGEKVYRDAYMYYIRVDFNVKVIKSGDSLNIFVDPNTAHSSGRSDWSNLSPKNKKNMREAIRLFKKSAMWKHALSQDMLGNIYYVGKGVPVDYKEAIKWYSMAAEQDIESSLYQLGQIHCFGKGVPKNFSRALEFYKRAADLGNLDAQHHVGNILLGNFENLELGYVSRNLSLTQSESPQNLEKYKEGIDYWLMIAEEGKNHKVINSLAIEYLWGEKVVKDIKRAMSYFIKGTELGNTHSMLNLGQQFHKGCFCDNKNYLTKSQSYERAYSFYSKATYKGSPLGPTRIDELLNDIVQDQMTGARERKKKLKQGGSLSDDEGLQSLDNLRKKIISLEKER